MHTVWKGAISFGLVTILAKLHATTDDKVIRLRQIHSKRRKPIKQEKVCPIRNEDLHSKSLVRGYEYAKERFVVITDAELKGLKMDAMGRSILSIKELKKRA